MLRIVLAFVLAAIASTYPTDNPISESPNILLASSDEPGPPQGDSSNDALLNTLTAVMEDCEPESEEDSEGVGKRSDEGMFSAVPARGCPSSNFLRYDRGRPDNFIRFGRGGREDSNFIRFGRGGRDDSNFIRFGRGGREDSNFIRFGRGGREDSNFIRFGRGKSDSNFIRLGRGGGGDKGNDNFIRFGRARPSNFVRFGRGRPDNFIRFGRGRDSNFLRFGRSGSLEEPAPFGTPLEVNEDSQRVGRGGKSGSNFIRLGRAGSSSFIRLGRDSEDQNEEDTQDRETRGRNSANFLRFGRRANNGNFLRFGRSSNSGELRRGKLTDRNFIRLGRSGSNVYEDDTDSSPARVERSENSRSFVRFGKRTEEDEDNLVRLSRDVEEIHEPPVLPSSDVNEDNSTSRTRRSIPYPKPEEEPHEGSYPVIIATSTGRNSGHDGKVDTSSFRYYSPLIPNYILAPELSLLGPLSGADSPTKRARGDGHNRNYIRLG